MEIIFLMENIKRQVDLRREDIKVKVDNDKLIQNIDMTRSHCMKLAKQVYQLTTDIEDSKKELDDLLIQFDTFDISENKFEDIQNRADTLKEIFNKMFMDYKGSLMENKNYVFSFDPKVPTEKFFGSFNVTRDFKQVTNLPFYITKCLFIYISITII